MSELPTPLPTSHPRRFATAADPGAAREGHSAAG